MSNTTLYAIASVIALELKDYQKKLVTISDMTNDPLLKTEINRLANSMRDLSTGAKEELDKVRADIKKGSRN